MKTSTFYRVCYRFLFLICLCIVIVGCSGDEPTPEPTVAAPTATTANEQPESPLNAPDSPLSTPATEVVTPTTEVITSTSEAVAPAAAPGAMIPLSEPINPQTTDTTGAATGRIFLQNAQGFRPVTNVIVALAEVITGDDGVERAAGYDAANAPRNNIRDDGAFVIENVPPGRYGVILDAVTTSILIKESENPENSLVITIEAGRVTELGDLVYASLALPGLIN